MSDEGVLVLIYASIGIIGYIIAWCWMAWIAFTEEDEFFDAMVMILTGSFLGAFAFAFWPLSLLGAVVYFFHQRYHEKKRGGRI